MVAGLTTGLNVSSKSMPSDNVDIWWARNKYPCVIVNESFRVSFHNPDFRACDHRVLRGGWVGGGGGGGGGGVVDGVCVVCGDGVDRGVGGVDCGVVC
ncbi:hypothetical protein Tco_0254760 [Tanacetum coccineum]